MQHLFTQSIGLKQQKKTIKGSISSYPCTIDKIPFNLKDVTLSSESNG